MSGDNDSKPEDDPEYDNLPEDIGGNFEPLDDYEQTIKDDVEAFHAPGENPHGPILGGFLFKRRAVEKLAEHGLEPNDASCALRVGRKGISRSTGREIVIGKCDRGRILVVYESCIEKADRAVALFLVVTAFRIR